MAVLLLIVVYIVFFSIGLPDGVLGGAWPSIYPSLGAPVGFGGIVALIVTVTSIISSLSTSFWLKKLKIGPLLAVSTALTAMALIGYSVSSSIYWLFAFAVPLGLGSGAIETALNHYVATHFKARHMNWLHASWGIGATLGPILFAVSLMHTKDWHKGFLDLGLIQIGIVIILLFSLSWWGKVHSHKTLKTNESPQSSDVKYWVLLKKKTVRLAFMSFFLYVGIEVGVGLWVASYLVNVQDVPLATAALWTGVYYGSITLGRIAIGLASIKVGTKLLIRVGLMVALLGVLLLVSDAAPAISIVGLVMIGAGFAPVYPGLIHETPSRFGKANSAKVIGLQIVAGSAGAATIPPLIGLLVSVFSFSAFAYIAITAVIMASIVIEWNNRSLSKSVL